MATSPDHPVRRIVYSSVPVGPRHPRDLDGILVQARHNNGMNGVSGLLVVAPDRYVQVLEGTPEAVSYIMGVIRDDERHTDVEVLSDVGDAERTFGGWTMANLPDGPDAIEVRVRLKRLLRNASEPVRSAFAFLD